MQVERKIIWECRAARTGWQKVAVTGLGGTLGVSGAGGGCQPHRQHCARPASVTTRGGLTAYGTWWKNEDKSPQITKRTTQDRLKPQPQASTRSNRSRAQTRGRDQTFTQGCACAQLGAARAPGRHPSVGISCAGSSLSWQLPACKQHRERLGSAPKASGLCREPPNCRRVSGEIGKSGGDSHPSPLPCHSSSGLW